MASRTLRTATTALVCAALVGAVSPAWAGEGDGAGGAGDAPLVGGFALGDGLEALVDPASGGLTLGLSVGGVGLGWDSRLVGVDRYGFGDAWAVQGLGYVDTSGGVRVFPAGSPIAYEMSTSEPSGLLGYPTDDLVFAPTEDRAPARTDVDVEQALAAVGVDASGAPAGGGFVLHELGGVVTYFTAAGDPETRISATGARTDWIWDPAVPHRLVGTASRDGVVTAIDWETQRNAVRVLPGVNLPATDPENPATIAAKEHAASEGTGPGPATDRPVWTIADTRDGITITDAIGARTEIATDRVTGLVTRVSGESGSETRLTWAPAIDGPARLSLLRTLDEDGTEVSSREWQPTGPASVTGWPLTDPAVGIAPTGKRETSVSDGPTRVVSAWNAAGQLTERRVEVSTGSGTLTMQEHAFAYPDVAPGSGEDWSRPTGTEVRFRDGSGGERTVRASYEFDELGRPTSRTDLGGATTGTRYWATGTRRDVTAADGAISYHWDGATLLNETHTTADGGAVSTTAHLIGATRHARTTAGDTAYFTTDRHANVTELTGAAGTVTARYRYADYGAPTSADRPGATPGDPSANPYGYSGEYTDADGTQLLSTRVYDPVTHVFHTMDSARLHNVYAYADLNPITNIDPSGQTATWDMALSWVFLGLGVALAAMSGGVAAATVAAVGWNGLGAFGIASLTVGVLADAATVASATAVLLDHYIPNLIDPKITNGLMWAETALALGAIAFGGLAYASGSALRKVAAGAPGPVLPAAQPKATPPPPPAPKILAWDAQGTPAAWDATDMSADEITEALSAATTGRGVHEVEFLMFETPAGTRFAFGALPADDAAAGRYTAARSGVKGRLRPSGEPNGSNHVILHRLMGVPLPKITTRMHLKDIAQARKDASGGMLAQPYLRKHLGPDGRPTGYKIHAFPRSGHFAANDPTVHWSDHKQALFIRFLEGKGFKVRLNPFDSALEDATLARVEEKKGRIPVAAQHRFE